MIYYREHNITKQLFRKGANGVEEYIFKEGVWKKTNAAMEAFYEGTDSWWITEEQANYLIERFKQSGV